MAKEDREKTSFSTPWGTYQFRMMGFGLCNVSRMCVKLKEKIPESWC